jgi:2-oxoisovalerate dehydrogenase E1 component
MDTFVPNLNDAAERERFGPVLRQALTIRSTEERLLALFGEGKLFGTVHTCIGQEFTGPAVAAALREGDTVFSNHRCHGHFIAVTGQVESLVAEVMGRATGVCGGVGGSQHLHHRGEQTFYSNGVQGGIVPVATGLAYAHRLEGRGAISVVFVGDGTLGEGALYESMNIASRWDLPLLVVLENNLYSQSTHQQQTLAGGIEERFAAFGLETARSSTWQWGALLDEVRASADAVRASGRPRLHRIDTYRLMAHSKGDDDRATEEVEAYRRRDPLTLLVERFASQPWLDHEMAGIRERVERAVASAEAAPFGPRPAPAGPAPPVAWRPAAFTRERVVTSVRDAIADSLEHDPKTVVIGEDVESPYGGAFKATAGLSERFPGRVRNAPLSEGSLVGVGNGLALAGWHPIVEIMFGDFLTLAADQWVNHAAKFAGMYGGGVRVPLTLRTPMGGHRGYGPTHSQSLERLFLGEGGTRVLALHHRASPGALYRELLREPDLPTLVIENKLLYGVQADPQPPAGFRLVVSDGRFPVSRLQPEGPADVTLVAIGGLSVEAERAVVLLLEEHEVLVDLFLPTQLFPLDISFLLESVARSGRLVTAEEGHGFASIGSEIIARVLEGARGRAIACARVHAEPGPIPSSRPLEAQCLPGAATIVNKVLEVVRG